MSNLGFTVLGHLAALTLSSLAITPAAAQWKPTKPITLIVPWAAGGSTDQVTRVTAADRSECSRAAGAVSDPSPIPLGTLGALRHPL